MGGNSLLRTCCRSLSAVCRLSIHSPGSLAPSFPSRHRTLFHCRRLHTGPGLCKGTALYQLITTSSQKRDQASQTLPQAAISYKFFQKVTPRDHVFSFDPTRFGCHHYLTFGGAGWEKVTFLQNFMVLGRLNNATQKLVGLCKRCPGVQAGLPQQGSESHEILSVGFFFLQKVNISRTNLCCLQPPRVPQQCLRDRLGMGLARGQDRLQLVQAQSVVPAPQGDDAGTRGAGSVEGPSALGGSAPP